MRRVDLIKGTAYPLGRENVDTDAILPAQWLKVTTRSGLGEAAFENLRREQASVFNDPNYSGSPILIAGANFGCGSSREHAVWAMLNMGIQAVIAPSFSDIFKGNALKNGMLAIALPKDNVQRLLATARTEIVTIDLAEQIVSVSGECYQFYIDPFRKRCLLEGLDEIDVTLASSDDIAAFERTLNAIRPWQLVAATSSKERRSSPDSEPGQ